MELVLLSAFIVLLIAVAICFAGLGRYMWNEAKASKRTREIADMQYEMSKAKYEAWLESNKKVGGSE